jgi:hypothetical protein
MRSRLFGVILLFAISSSAPGQPVSRLESRDLRVELMAEDGSIRLLDKSSGVVWNLKSPQIIFEDQRTVDVRSSPVVRRRDGAVIFGSEQVAEFELKITADPPSVEYSCTPRSELAEIRLLQNALPLEAGVQNYYVVPKKMGVLLPAGGDKPFTNRLQGYGDGGYTMAMFGAVQNRSALLVSWDDPYTDLIVDYSVAPHPQLSTSLACVFRGPASRGYAVSRNGLLTAGLTPRYKRRTVRLQPLGRGGYVEIAKAYRQIVQERGYLKTLAEKLRDKPSTELLFGAADFKVFAFSRTVPHTRWNPTDTERVRVNFTFDQCAELAEHLRKDIGIDRALFVVNGWIRRGYDNQHPDVLPAAAEAGGNEGLAACSRRVKALGWLFGLHDNYQNLYKDAPSWNESYIMKKADGSLVQRGVWAGGPAFIICSKEQLTLAARNMPEIHRLFGPTAFFSDQVLAAPLYECFDKNHPMTRQDDMRYKVELSKYIRRIFGIFGTEDGQEWDVPYTDYFEGLMAHKTRYHQRDPDDIVIPLFELVYGDAIPIYTHQGDRPKPDQPTYVLDHILYAEMPVYYFGGPRYWAKASEVYRPPEGAEARMVFARGDRFNLIDQFIKNTYEVLSPLNRITALLPMTDHRFLTSDRKVESTRFGSDVEITVNYGAADFKTKRAVLPQYGFLVESPKLVAFYARRYRDLSYDDPPLFVLKSLDGRPLSSSTRVRVYHGFGDDRVQFRDQVVEVDVEKVLGAGGLR